MNAKSIVAALGMGMLGLSGCVASAGYGPRYYPPQPYGYGYGYRPRTEVIVAPGYRGGYGGHHDHGYRGGGYGGGGRGRHWR